MAGLYTKNDLSEVGLNATEAIQKLYAPQIHQDLLLFAFASRLESSISSPDLESDNQVYGLVNQPLADSQGNTSLRTKFITQGRLSSDLNSITQTLYTFSDENQIWFEKFSGALDQRIGEELSIGAPIKISVDGSIVAASIQSSGERYSIKSSDGNLVSLPASVNVRVFGKESKASNAIVNVTVSSDGTISRATGLNIIEGGSGYIYNEFLELLPACKSYETSVENKCGNYIDNALYFESYAEGRVSTPALLKNEKYLYRVKFADRNGFFLFDDKTSKYVYLGLFYDVLRTLAPAISPSLIVKRLDQISSENFVQLYNLNGRSLIWDYDRGYESVADVSSNLRNLSTSTETLRSEFKAFIQNNRIQKTEFDKTNNLGTRYNIVTGRSISTNFRMIFRDPDGVLDQPTVSFFDIVALGEADNTALGTLSIPGIWLWTGERYQRAFSTDDTAFVSQSGRLYLSPAIYDITGTELANSGANKYSISASFYKPEEPLVIDSIKGFDSQVSTLVQNISSAPGAGGFVFWRQLTVNDLNATLKSWPLFSYLDGITIKDARVLAI
jgi:hypothetical protein